MRWLSECSRDAVVAALDAVAPQLAGQPVVLSSRQVQNDPMWASSSAFVGDEYVVKFAWARPAALRLQHEIEALRALDGVVARVPTVVAAADDPLLLVVGRVAGSSLYDVYDKVDPGVLGAELGSFLAELHGSTVLPDAPPTAVPPAGTDRLRDGLGKWIRPDQRALVASWCDRVDGVLATPGRQALVHGDFHGDNQVWRDGRLRVVLDFETVGRADAEYDFRAIAPLGWSAEPLVQAVRHYERASNRPLSMDRVLAWHTRTTLGDALWRSEAGIALPDGRSAEQWVDDLAVRLRR
jgi:aminoglycoside phosphotransferase (APT) family kinase protein